MAQYRCTQCGAIVNAEESVKVGTCPSCGALFVFPNDFPQKAALYRRAADMRDAGNFSAALVNYSRILKIDATETEAHWGYLLSRYGVEILRSGEAYGQILFHRLETASFVKDPSYEKMLEYCPADARYYYEGMSRHIEEMHAKMLEIARRQGEYDIYLDCTEAPGTEGFLLANQVGTALDQAGYRVFLPCTMLEQVPPGERNLYEMAAVQKSAAMLVTAAPGTDWQEPRMKAAWRRFWERMQEDPTRKLLSVYRDIDPGKDMPMELSALQSINCGVPAFQNVVLQQVNNLFGRSGRSMDLNRQILALQREAEEAMGQKDFDRALGRFGEVAKLDREESTAYWGMVRSMTEDLTKPRLQESLDVNYQRALQFANDKQRAQYRQAMRDLMADPAWEALRSATKGFTDPDASYDDQEERVHLYVPRSDPRLAQIDAYKKECSRMLELRALSRKYQQRDAVAQPLFATQRQVESRLLANRTGKKRPTRMYWQFLAAMGLFLLTQIVWVFRLGQPSGAWWMSVIRWLLCTSGLVFTAWGLILSIPPVKYSLGGILLGTAVMIFVLPKFGGTGYMIAIVVAALLSIFHQVAQLVFGLSVGRDYVILKKAITELREVDKQIIQAYREEADGINRSYGVTGCGDPDYYPAHSKGVILEMPKNQKPLTGKNLAFLAASLAGCLALAVGATALSNFLYTGGWHNVVSIKSAYYVTLGLREDGTVAGAGYNGWSTLQGIHRWTDIKKVAIGLRFSAGLQGDGKVAVACDKDLIFKRAEKWTDIIDIGAVNNVLVGLKSDGTCVAVGSNEYGECNVEDWTDVKQLVVAGTSGFSTTLGLKNNGDIYCTHEEYNQYIQAARKALGPVEKIYGEWATFVLVSQDGRMCGSGNNGVRQITSMGTISSGDVRDVTTRGLVSVLHEDGTVEAWGELGFDLTQLEEWEDVVAIASGNENLFGLRSDGTCLSFGLSDYGQGEIEDWSGLKSLAAGATATFGIKEDGTVLSAGREAYGMTYVETKNPLELVQFWIGSLSWM